MMLVAGITAAFVCLLVLPVVFAYATGKRKGGGALFISRDKVHDPRYFAKSFSALMQQSEIDQHTRKVKLSRMEEIDRITELGFPKQQYDNVVFCSGKLLTVVPQNMDFSKEIYAEKDICLAGDTVLRSLCCRQNLIIGNGVVIGRWADAEGTAAVYDNCDLGLSMTSASGLSIGSNCTFCRLYAPEILLGWHPQDTGAIGREVPKNVLALDEKSPQERNIRYVMDDMRDENGVVPYTLITDRDLVVTEGLVVQGDIRSEKGVRLCENAIVCGNVFAEEDIVLGCNACVLGTVFTQGSVTLEDGAAVGRREKIASLIARDHIFIHGSARVYGYISCEKGGVVNVAASPAEAKAAFAPEQYEFLYLTGGAVPRLLIALSNDRLLKVQSEDLYRFPAGGALAALDPDAPDDSKPVSRPAVQLAVLAGILLVCTLGAFIYHLLAPQVEQVGETPTAELYHNQGLTQDIQLSSLPVSITEDYVVFTDRVLQRFHVSPEEIAQDAAIYDSVLDLVPEGVNKYVMLVPLRIYYEQVWKEYGGDMEAAAAQFASLMPRGTVFIDLFDALPSGQDQYVFFRTEPYWAGEGAYYGASAFFAEKGEPLPALESYRQALYQNFEGSLFDLTDQSKGDDSTYDDRIYVYTQPDFTNQEILFRRQTDGSYTPGREPILSKSRTAMSSYVGNSTFSHAILKGSVKNGKTMLLIGDTSAKIMASYFTEAYETVYVINQRWYSQDDSAFSDIFRDYNVTDTLMIQSMSALGDELNRSRVMRIVHNNVS